MPADALAPPGAAAPPPRWLRAAALALVLALGAWARLRAWPEVFTPEGVHLYADSDVEYHALRAQRILEDFPRLPWRDPAMNYPDGAWIPWPPLFDQALAATALAIGGGAGTAEHVDLAAAFLPVGLGVATLLLASALGATLLGGGAWFTAALLLALLPVHVDYSRLGRADHHVAEVFLACWVFLAYVAAWSGGRPGKARRPLALGLMGLGLTLAVWNMRVAGAVCAGVLVAHAGLGHVLGGGRALEGQVWRAPAALSAGAAVATALGADSVGLWGPPGAFTETRLLPLSAFQVALSAGVASFAGLLWLAGRRGDRGWPWRAAEVLGAGAASLGLAALVPGFRAEVGRALVALGRQDGWYAGIIEFEPILFSGARPLRQDVVGVLVTYGLGFPAMALGAWALVRRWRAAPQRRGELLFLLAWGGAFAALTVFRRRFGPYLAPVMVLWGWVAISEGVEAVRRRAPRLGPWGARAAAAGGVLLFLAPCALYLRPHAPDAARSDLYAALDWMRGLPLLPQRPAILASWGLGHYVERRTGRPVVVNGFGTEVAPEGMRDVADFYLAAEPARAEEVLTRHAVGYVVLGEPGGDVSDASGYARDGVIRPLRLARHWLTGASAASTPRFGELVASRLYYRDGDTPSAGLPPLGGFRLLYESRIGHQSFGEVRSNLKVFGVVPGAAVTIVGAEPGGLVSVELPVATLRQRGFTWRAWARADAEGRAFLRLPYATGRNGAVTAGAYRVTAGSSQRSVWVEEPQVVTGAAVTVDLTRS